MLMAAAAIRTASPARSLSPEAVGKNGCSPHKFRRCVDAEAASGPVWASKRDPRVRRRRVPAPVASTKCAALERAERRHDFVGPAERPEFVIVTEQIRFYGRRHVVRPGLTGWAQGLTYGATTEDALQKLSDLYYIKNLSLALDFYIIFETVKTVILRKGA